MFDSRSHHVGLVVSLVAVLGAAPAQTEEVRLVYVGPADASVWKGVQQGLSEANTLGRFTGQTYVLNQVTPERFQKDSSRKAALAILAAVDANTLTALSKTAEADGGAVLNLTAEDDALRRECRHNLLHIIPSAKMRADAVAQWSTKSKSTGAQALAWHADFRKFAARELNNRFRKAQGAPMDDAAWAGWAAVKMVSEAVARTQSTSPKTLLAYLKEEMEFDGQKGAPHSFRDTGQLRQPLLIVEQGKLVAEAPVRGVAETDDLDSLGLPSCQGEARRP